MNDSSLTIRPFAFAIPCVLGLACSGGDEWSHAELDYHDLENDPEALAIGDVDEAEQAVINGSTNFTTFQHEKWTTVGISTPRPGGYVCSGTLLRNNVVLTARHCVTTDGNIGGPVTTNPGGMRVRVQGYPTSLCSAYTTGTCTTVSTIVPASYSGYTHGNVDAALLVLSAPLTVNGDSQNVFTALNPYDAPTFMYRWPVAVGYGVDENGVLGVEKWGQMSIFETDIDYGVYDTNTGEYGPEIFRGSRAENEPTGTALGGGDSGGGAWVRDLAQPSLIGINSASGGFPGATSVFAQVSDIRYTFNDYIEDNLTPIVSYGAFGSATLDALEHVEGDASTNANWQISGTAIIQKNNTPKALLIVNARVYENVVVTARLSGTDNDAMGIVVRYIDENNYLRCEADDQNNRLRLLRRRAGSEAVIATSTWNGTFSTARDMTFSIEEKSLSCSFNGVTVSGTDAGFVVGRIGLYNNYNDEGKFHSMAAGSLNANFLPW